MDETKGTVESITDFLSKILGKNNFISDAFTIVICIALLLFFLKIAYQIYRKVNLRVLSSKGEIHTKDPYKRIVNVRPRLNNGIISFIRTATGTHPYVYSSLTHPETTKRNIYSLSLILVVFVAFVASIHFSIGITKGVPFPTRYIFITVIVLIYTIFIYIFDLSILVLGLFDKDKNCSQKLIGGSARLAISILFSFLVSSQLMVLLFTPEIDNYISLNKEEIAFKYLEMDNGNICKNRKNTIDDKTNYKLSELTVSQCDRSDILKEKKKILEGIIFDEKENISKNINEENKTINSKKASNLLLKSIKNCLYLAVEAEKRGAPPQTNCHSMFDSSEKKLSELIPDFTETIKVQYEELEKRIKIKRDAILEHCNNALEVKCTDEDLNKYKSNMTSGVVSNSHDSNRNAIEKSLTNIRDNISSKQEEFENLKLKDTKTEIDNSNKIKYINEIIRKIDERIQKISDEIKYYIGDNGENSSNILKMIILYNGIISNFDIRSYIGLTILLILTLIDLSILILKITFNKETHYDELLNELLEKYKSSACEKLKLFVPDVLNEDKEYSKISQNNKKDHENETNKIIKILGDAAEYLFDLAFLLVNRSIPLRLTKIFGTRVSIKMRVSMKKAEKIANAIWPDKKSVAIFMLNEDKEVQLVLVTTAKDPDSSKDLFSNCAKLYGYKETIVPSKFIYSEKIPTKSGNTPDLIEIYRMILELSKPKSAHAAVGENSDEYNNGRDHQMLDGEAQVRPGHRADPGQDNGVGSKPHQ